MRGRDDVESIALRYMLDGLGINPGAGEIPRTSPNGARQAPCLFPGAKAVWV